MDHRRDDRDRRRPSPDVRALAGQALLMPSTKSCPSRSASVRTPAKPAALERASDRRRPPALSRRRRRAQTGRAAADSLDDEAASARPQHAMCFADERRRHPVDVGLATGRRARARRSKLPASNGSDRRQRCVCVSISAPSLLRDAVGRAAQRSPRLVDRHAARSSRLRARVAAISRGSPQPDDEHAIAELGRSHPDAERRQRGSLTEGRQDLEQHRSRFALPSDDIVLPVKNPQKIAERQGKAGCPARRHGRGQHDHDCRCAWRCATGWRSRSAR